MPYTNLIGAGWATNGAPLIPGGGTIPLSSNYIFVSNVTGANGSDGNPGTMDLPFLTFNAAVTYAGNAGLFPAGTAPTLVVMQGHAENVSSATTWKLNVVGMSVIGLGSGSSRPTFTFDTGTSSTFNVSANGISVSNCIFVANFAAVAQAFTLTTATDFRLQSCEFRDTDASHNFVGIVKTGTTSNAADGMTIDSCTINLLATSGAVAIFTPSGTNDRCRISNNSWISQSTNAAALIPIATGKLLTNFLLLNNHFNIQNAAGTATGYLITTNGSTNSGFIDGNVDHALPTTPLLCTLLSGFVYGINYHSDQADLSGYIVPGQDT